MNIRNFAVADYPAIVHIDSSLNIVWPERPRTPQAWAAADQRRDSRLEFQRLVAVTDGKVVGFGSYAQNSLERHAHRFHINVEVGPNYQRLGIGAALYDRIMAELHPLNPRVLRADAFTNLRRVSLFFRSVVSTKRFARRRSTLMSHHLTSIHTQVWKRDCWTRASSSRPYMM